MLAGEVVELGEGGPWPEYVPTHHGLMSAQKHESSGPQPAHDNVPLLADLDQFAMSVPSHREKGKASVLIVKRDIYDNHPG